jgi:KUP system potassium uptake protein
MVTITAIIVWRINILLVLFGFLIFASIDGLYLSSALTKVPEGAWFTLMLGGALAIILLIWRHGKETQWKAERSDRIKVSELITSGDDGKLYLREKVGDDGELPKMKGDQLVQSLPRESGSDSLK